MSSLYSFLIALVLVLKAVNGQDPALPDLPDRFSAIVEANILNKNYSIVMEEYYDYNLQKARRSFVSRGNVTTVLEDFSETNSAFFWTTSVNDVYNPDFCTIQSNPQGFPPNRNNITGLASSQEWFQFGSDFEEVYLGDSFTVRGIPARAWNRYVVANNTFNNVRRLETFNLTYYFSHPSWNIRYMDESEIPLRAEIYGRHLFYDGNTNTTTNYSFDHIYDYVKFFVGDDAFDTSEEFNINNLLPEWYEQCNFYKFCDDNPDSLLCHPSNQPDIPTLPQQFQARIEVNYKNTPPKNSTAYFQLYYDYIGNRAHTLWRDSTDYFHGTRNQIDLFDDRQRWLWTGDSLTIEDCEITLINSSYTGQDEFIPEKNGHLGDPYSWFLWNVSSEIFLGYETKRGISTEVWYSQDSETGTYKSFQNGKQYKYNSSMDLKWYFNRGDWNLLTANTDIIPIALELCGSADIWILDEDSNKWIFNDTYDMEIEYAVFDFWAGVPTEKNSMEFGIYNPPTNYRKYCTVTEEYCDYDNNFNLCQRDEPLPTLPSKFTAIVEAVFTNANYTMTIYEAYDNDTNRAKISYLPHYSPYGRQLVTRYNLEADKIIYNWASDGSSCNISRARDKPPRPDTNLFFNYQNEHVMSTSDWLYGFDINNQDTVNDIRHMGHDFNVRGYPCDRWDYDMVIEDANEAEGYSYQANVTLSIYFELDKWASHIEEIEYIVDTGHYYRKPIQLYVTGTSRYQNTIRNVDLSRDFEHAYNYINFQPYSEIRREHFLPPMNMECDIREYCKDPVNVESEDMKDNELLYFYYEDLQEECKSSEKNQKNKQTSCYTLNYENEKDIDNTLPLIVDPLTLDCYSQIEYKKSSSANNKHMDTSLAVLLVFISLFIGIFISYIYYKCVKSRAKHSFGERVPDDEDGMEMNTTKY